MSPENESKKAALAGLFAPKTPSNDTDSSASGGGSNPLLGSGPSGGNGGSGRGAGAAAASSAGPSRVQMMKAEADAKEAERIANGGEAAGALSPNTRAAPDVRGLRLRESHRFAHLLRVLLVRDCLLF